MNFESETSEFKESLNKSCIFPKSQFPHVQNGVIKHHFTELLRQKHRKMKKEDNLEITSHGT